MPDKPDFSLEAACTFPVAGVDEAGRGPWAGPVVAAAVIFEPGRIPKGINDSKKLTPARREALYEEILAVAAASSIAQASVEEIDTLNILRATQLAMKRAVEALSVTPSVALVDGNQPPKLTCEVRCIVAGDASCLSIAAASILAKVARDRLMRELAALYPAYGFDRHAGYGTPEHREALARHGVTPHHRRSFAPIRALLEQQPLAEAG